MSSPRHTITIRLNARQREAVQRLAESEGVSEEEAVLRAVEKAGKGAPSMLELAGDLIGSVEGPPDLSTNKSYLHGLGEPKSRAEKGVD